MGTTSEELKKLYKKLGGKDPKVAGFSAPGEILNAINEIPLPTEYELPTVTTEDAGDVLVVNEEGKWDKGEAGGGLPEVTTEDNGDILQVVNGAWAKAAMSKDVVIYNVTRGTDNKITLPCTYTELLNNVQNKDVILNVKNGNTTTYTQMRCGGYNTSGDIFFIGIKSAPTTTSFSSSYVEFPFYSNVGIVHDATLSFTEA